MIPWLFAIVAPALALPTCPTEADEARMTRFEQRLAGADSVQDAREAAHDKVDAARTAVDRAARIVPGDEALPLRQAELEALSHAIDDAQTPEQVAAEFTAVRTERGNGRCDYSTGEVVAIVIGFVLGILPGILLLILLC